MWEMWLRNTPIRSAPPATDFQSLNAQIPTSFPMNPGARGYDPHPRYDEYSLLNQVMHPPFMTGKQQM